MASNTTRTRNIRKAKARAAGAGRKKEVRRAQRDIAEDKLERALGERISLPTVRR